MISRKLSLRGALVIGALATLSACLPDNSKVADIKAPPMPHDFEFEVDPKLVEKFLKEIENRTVVDAAKLTNMSIQISDPELREILNQAEDDSRFLIQGGTIVREAAVNEKTAICELKVKKEFNNTEAAPVSAKNVAETKDAASSHVSLTTDNQGLTLSCSNMKADDKGFLLNDLRVILGGLVLIKTSLLMEETKPVDLTGLANELGNGLGKKMELMKNEDGKTSKISLSFPETSEHGTHLIMSFKMNQLIGVQQARVSPSYIALYDKKSAKFVTEWTDTGLGESMFTPDASQIILVTFPKDKTAEIKKSLRDLIVVISVAKGQPEFSAHFDLGELCTTQPNAIYDYENLQAGCPK